MFNNYVTDYRITWRHCASFNDSKAATNIVKLFENKAAIMGLNLEMGLGSEINIYRHSDHGAVRHNIELDFDYGNPCGHIKFEEQYNFNRQEEHYFTEVIGMLCHRNMMFGNAIDEYTFYFVLEPIYITYEECKCRLYPLVKLRDNMIMIEYRVFPNKNRLSCNDFVSRYSNFVFKKIDKIEMDINLFKLLLPNAEIKDQKQRRHDDCEHSTCIVEEGGYKYLKDISLAIIKLIADDEYIDWVGHATYSIKTCIPNKKIVSPLLFAVDRNIKLIGDQKITNYREFKDYLHYVTPGNTVTIGNILDTYMFADCVDEELVFFMTKISDFKKRIEYPQKSEEKYYIELYEEILRFKHDFFKQYNHIMSVRKIMNDIWEELKCEQVINEIKSMVEVKLKQNEITKNEQLLKLQLYFSFIAVILSSAPLYEYIALPGISRGMGLEVDLIPYKYLILIYIACVAVVAFVLWLTKIMIIRRKSI